MRMQLIDHQTRLQLPGSWPRALAPPALNRMDHPTPFLVCDLETARERSRPCPGCSASTP
jgi:hypothetical protein